MAARTWDFSGPTGNHVVTVDRSETGKDVIRIDGRVAARPLGEDEPSRRIVIDGTPHLLRRVEDGFELDLSDIEEPEFHVPVASLPDPHRFWRVVMVIAFLVVGGVTYAFFPTYQRQAASRVRQMLTNMSEGKNSEKAETAIALWAKGQNRISATELGWAISHYPDFQNAKNLRRTFTSWEVLDTEGVDDAERPTAIVTVEVEGQRMRMLVPDKMPISWAE